MNPMPTSSRIGLGAISLGLVAILALTTQNAFAGNPLKRALASEIKQSDASLSVQAVSCMASHASQAVAAASIQQPGPQVDHLTTRANAITNARMVCVD